MLLYDGMTLPGYLAPVTPGQIALRFRYRIVSPIERAEWNDISRNLDTVEKREFAAAEWITRYLAEWDLKYPENWPVERLRGKPIKISQQFLAKYVHPIWFSKLFNCVLGIGPPDPDPMEAEKEQQRKRELAAMDPESRAKAMAEEEDDRVGNSSGEPG